MKFANPWSKAVVSVFQNVCSQSCPTLRDPMGCNPPGSSAPGITPPGILERVAVSFSRGSSRPRNRTWVSCSSCRSWFSTTEPAGREALSLSRHVWLSVLGWRGWECHWQSVGGGQKGCSASSKAHSDLSGQGSN